MSLNTTFKTWEVLMDFLKTVDYPQCFTVNYLPKSNEYEIWIGNQPYYIYEDWIEERENEIKELKDKNKKLKNNYDELMERVEVAEKLLGFKL